MKIFLIIFIIAVTPNFSLAQFSEFESFDFKKADSIASLYADYDLHDQEKLTQLLTKDLASDIERFRAIFKWITNNVSYDMDLYEEKLIKEARLRYKRKKLEKWLVHFNRRVLKKIITNKSSICHGYSTLLQSMCTHAGIQCEIVEGYGRTFNDKIGYGKINHAWNAVNLNDKWYLSDPTWASGTVDVESNKFQRKFQKNYFLADPRLFIANHYPKQPSWILLYDKPSLKEFLNAPLKTSGFMANKINHYRPGEGFIKVNRDSTIRFSFTSNLPIENINNISIELYKKVNRSYKYQEGKHFNAIQDQEGYFYMDYPVREKGEYLIYIFIKRKLTLVYEVSCK